MTDSDLGRIWAKHFPKRRNGHVSEQICRMICLIIEKRILLELTNGGYHTTVLGVLQRCNISADEFSSCRELTRPLIAAP
jgi:hypothetical protein